VGPLVVLITGGCGYVGSFLARQLPENSKFKGETVRIFDNLSAGNWPTVASMPKENKYELIVGDICDSGDAARALKDVDVVFHLGGPVGAAAGADGGKPAREVIAEGTKRFLELCVSKNVNEFVNTSTGGVYGRIKAPISREDTECFPQSAYSEAKLETDLYCMNRARETGMHVVSLRLGTVSGYNVVMRMENFLHVFAVYASIGRGLPIWRETMGKLRPFVDIRDVAQAFILAATNPAMAGNIVNVCGYNATADSIADYIRTKIPDARNEITEHALYSQNNFDFPMDGSKLESFGFMYRYKMQDTVDALLPKYDVYYRTRLSSAG
jgi:nucleoside-diphosphate-sugar epimerase